MAANITFYDEFWQPRLVY